MLAAMSDRLKFWAGKVASLVVTGLLLGLVYDWAAPRLFRADDEPGFVRGAVHGALMPVALPALVMGRNVPIYAPRGDHRWYKLGYIAGINLCGLVFFGLAFRPPRVSKTSPDTPR